MSWERLNKMLEEDSPSFDACHNPASVVWEIAIKSMDVFRSGVSNFFKNANRVAELEYIYSGQPIECTLLQLQCAENPETATSSNESISVFSKTPLSEFLIEAQKKFKTVPIIYVSASRLRIIDEMFRDFGSKHSEIEQVAPTKPGGICQIIFDSADLKSAVDQLILNALDRTNIAKVRSVLVQESIRDSFQEQLKARADTFVASSSHQTLKDDLINLQREFGGELPRSIESADAAGVDFFRTPKEAIQLAKANCPSTDTFSIWTEKISLAYEIRNNLNAKYTVLNLIYSSAYIESRFQQK